MADDKKIIFSMVGVSKAFQQNKQVLKDIYLSFFYGAKIGIIGLNGSGKSTLLKIIAGLDKSYQGEVVFSPGYSVGYLPQEPQLDNTKTVKFSYDHIYNYMVKRPQFVDAATYASAVNEARANDGLGARYTADEIGAFRDGTYPYLYPNVNWVDETYRHHGVTNKYNVEFTGGGKNFRYYTMVNLITDKGDAQLTPIEIGDSDDLSVGEWVMAIGSPFGNEQSVSTGIVSALYRSTAMQSSTGTTIYANMIQTDAAINPGNSGGALVDSEGKLVGINSIIESYSGSSSGVGFAIPVNYAINIANQIIAGETPAHPYLGVSVTSVNAFVARRENLSVSEGALISQVNEGTPAAEAGLEVNDIVTAVDDEPVTSADGLIMALREHEVGDKVTLTVVRGNETKKIEVTLGSDADLQADQQDTSSGNGAMTEEEFLQYLQELMGQNGGNLGGRIG